MAPDHPEKLLILVPAYNEEGAIRGVVEGVKQVMPGTPVLVVDDCSKDNTVANARSAGAGVLPLPHHLGLASTFRIGIRKGIPRCRTSSHMGENPACADAATVICPTRRGARKMPALRDSPRRISSTR